MYFIVEPPTFYCSQEASQLSVFEKYASQRHFQINSMVKGKASRCFFSSRRNSFFFSTFNHQKIVQFLEESKTVQLESEQFVNENGKEKITVPARLHNIMLSHKLRLGKQLLHSGNKIMFENIFGAITPSEYSGSQPINKRYGLQQVGQSLTRASTIKHSKPIQENRRTQDTHIKNCLVVQRRLRGKVFDFKNMDPEEVKKVKDDLRRIRKQERKAKLRQKKKLKKQLDQQDPSLN